MNNVWAGYERLNAGAWEEWNAPFWTQPMELFDAMFTGGVRAHYVTAALCAPLLTAAPARGGEPQKVRVRGRCLVSLSTNKPRTGAPRRTYRPALSPLAISAASMLAWLRGRFAVAGMSVAGRERLPTD